MASKFAKAKLTFARIGFAYVGVQSAELGILSLTLFTISRPDVPHKHAHGVFSLVFLAFTAFSFWLMQCRCGDDRPSSGVIVTMLAVGVVAMHIVRAIP